MQSSLIDVLDFDKMRNNIDHSAYYRIVVMNLAGADFCESERRDIGFLSCESAYRAFYQCNLNLSHNEPPNP